MLGMDFLKEQRCVMDYGKDLIQFPMQSDFWWPLFVSSIFQTNVNVSENDESADEQVSENLDSCVELSFLSQRQC